MVKAKIKSQTSKLYQKVFYSRDPIRQRCENVHEQTLIFYSKHEQYSQDKQHREASIYAAPQE
jgi:hypothetical protein